jgi:hypothetical protein
LNPPRCRDGRDGKGCSQAPELPEDPDLKSMAWTRDCIFYDGKQLLKLLKLVDVEEIHQSCPFISWIPSGYLT